MDNIKEVKLSVDASGRACPPAQFAYAITAWAGQGGSTYIVESGGYEISMPPVPVQRVAQALMLKAENALYVEGLRTQVKPESNVEIVPMDDGSMARR